MAWKNNSRRVPRAAAAGATAALGLGLGAGIAHAGSAASHAQKVPLSTANINCDGSSAPDQGSGPGEGFVVYNRPANGTVIAVVVLQDARPDTTYSVRLIQSVSDCGTVDATITTDSLGDGSANVHEAVADNGTVFVAVNNTADPYNDYFTTGATKP
jgi:hypothetical protein